MKKLSIRVGTQLARLVFSPSCAPKVLLFRASDVTWGSCFPHDAKWNSDFFVDQRQAALEAEIKLKSAIYVLSLSKYGYHSTSALECELTNTSHM